MIVPQEQCHEDQSGEKALGVDQVGDHQCLGDQYSRNAGSSQLNPQGSLGGYQAGFDGHQTSN